MRNKILLIIAFFAALSISNAQERIVVIGHGLTEIVCELGFAEKIVAVDTQSEFPPEIAELPKVGYYQGVSSTMILNDIKPDMIIARSDAGPFIQIADLKNMIPNYLDVLPANDFDDIKAGIRLIADNLGVQDKAEKLIDQMEEKVITIERKREDLEILPKAIFLRVSPKGELLAYGEESEPNKLLTLAGGYNTMIYNSQFKSIDIDFFNMSDQDVIFIARENLNKVGGLESIILNYNINKTKAHKNDNIVVVDYDRFTSFGTRFPEIFSKVVESYLKVPVKDQK